MSRVDLRMICPSSGLADGYSESFFSGEAISVDMATTEKMIADVNGKPDMREYHA